MRTVAVCLGGLLRSLPQVAESIQEHLIRPLNADLFLSGPIDFVAEWSAALAAFPSLTEVRFERENVTQFLVGLSHHHGWGNSGWRAASGVRGNWLGCLTGETKDMHRAGSGLCQMYGHRQCLKMIEEHEQKRGANYSHIVWSRPDMFWLGDHLPIHVIPEGERNFIWVVDGEDNGGLNDRHWVLPRHIASEMLSSWDRLMDGSLADFFVGLTVPQLSAEAFFAYNLARSGDNRLVRRLPSLSFVMCSNYHNRKKNDLSARTWEEIGRLGNVNVRCQPGGPKYRHEYEHARNVASCKQDTPWTLELIWHCWCSDNKEDVLQFLEYRLCVFAKAAASGWEGPLKIVDWAEDEEEDER